MANKHHLYRYPETPKDRQGRWEHVHKLWALSDYLHKLYESIPRRMEMVNSKGGSIKY